MMTCSMPGGDGLLDRVLDDRLVDQRQHLLGLRLGRRQEAGAPAGGGEDGFSDAHRTSEWRVGRSGAVYAAVAGGPRQPSPGGPSARQRGRTGGPPS